MFLNNGRLGTFFTTDENKYSGVESEADCAMWAYVVDLYENVAQLPFQSAVFTSQNGDFSAEN